MSLSLKAVTSYVPETIKLLSENYENFGMNAKEAQVFQRFYGVDAIPVTNDSILDFMLKVAEPLMKTLTYEEKKLVKYVIVPRTAPSLEYFGISSVQQLIQRLNIHKAVAFSIGMNKCASLLRAFEVSECLLKSEQPGSMVLIVVGEPVFTNETRFLPSISVSGDGAGAALVHVKEDADHQWISSSIITLGEYAEGSWMSPQKLSFFGQIFESMMFKAATQALEKAELTWEDMKIILPHNVNMPCWRGFAKFAQLPLDKFYLKNIAKTSHCFNADWLINWNSMMNEGCVKKGDYYMMATVAVGAVFGVGIFRY